MKCTKTITNTRKCRRFCKILENAQKVWNFDNFLKISGHHGILQNSLIIGKNFVHFFFIRTALLKPKLSVLKKITIFQLQMFLKCSHFFYTIQVQFKIIFYFISPMMNENTYIQHLFHQCRKRHLSKFLILIVTL